MAPLVDVVGLLTATACQPVISTTTDIRPGRPRPAPAYHLTVSLRAVITDWGGVPSPPIAQLVRAWADADHINWEAYVAVITPWLTAAYDLNSAPNPVHALERGECTPREFERLLAERLVRIDGGPVRGDGLLTRMMSVGQPIEAMYDLLRGLRADGLRTALLSNSWGDAGYPRADFPSLFDTVVISHEVGMRKPEARIFAHTAQLLGVAPADCVFIDDIAANVAAAEAAGMTGILHSDPETTAMRLADLIAGNRGA